MNNEQTIKAVAPILASFFRSESTAEEALDLIGPIFKANDTAFQAVSGQNAVTATGFRVIDPEGGTHEYPDADGLLITHLDLLLSDEDGKTIAIFHRWEHVERIA